MPSPSDLCNLIKICQGVSTEVPRWTQGTGGNISVKEEDALWIKTSGVRLRDVSETYGISCINLASFLPELNSLNRGDEAGYRSAVLNHATKGYPSSETGLHAVLPGRWVIHLHSIGAIAMAHHYFADVRKLRSWLKFQKLKICVLNCVTPGLELTSQFVETGGEAWIVRNHGVVLQSAEDNPLAILNLWRQIEEDFCERWKLNLKSDNCFSPLKAYFPDGVVFQERIREVTEGSGENYRLKPQAFSLDRDATELFQAIQILHRECPHLEEIPVEMRPRGSFEGASYSNKTLDIK